MRRENRAKLFQIGYSVYQISHIAFNLCWSIRLIEEKIVWWIWLGVAVIFLVALLGCKELREDVNTKKSKKEKVLSLVWCISCGVSGFVHSPRF